ncbi:tyrosine-protein phosphatase [Vagococcus xieshaowenii]|uniref:Tyrosine-protein phosphatase n=1 Tax=Vagococcus xieshaowenii TaxID=2562451 RepID=A0A4Z0DEF1_9ENTE|nr:CpsB/CapC family capsule biosynthesis tyrosine phosphatase [Vagococcus xieshaowenii]QCA29252.1 tyrosine protein phosphatase [Vagococcus xieshaowenii]TFZ43194.1 tyrosine protein phosphatase [Vagococcus xieshaowenii]
MIDLHCHILPGLDDGAQNVEDSLEMARKAVDSGITHILCTPHHNGKYRNHKAAIMDAVADLQAILDEEQIPLTLFEGQEVRISGELIEEYEADLLLGTDVADHYLLIEFPTQDVPKYTEQLFFELLAKGITPVIVHPERNSVFIEDPNKLIPFIEMGILTQMTAPSYVGVFGKKIQKVSEQMLAHNLIHMMASDAHNLKTRNFYLAEAYAKLRKEYGKAKVYEFEQVAKALINGDKVEVPEYQEIKKKRFGFF